MTMKEWFLTELESEAAKSRRVLEQVPAGQRDWKPHERSMALGYLADLVANIFSWVDLAVSRDELDIAPKDGPKYQPAALNTSAEFVAALDAAVSKAREALQQTTDAHLETPWRLLAGGNLAFEQPRLHVIRDTFLHSAHHRGQMTVYLRLLGSKVPSVYGPTADDRSFG
jgi:uncharacterized damage-inducible protein DinB